MCFHFGSFLSIERGSNRCVGLQGGWSLLMLHGLGILKSECILRIFLCVGFVACSTSAVLCHCKSFMACRSGTWSNTMTLIPRKRGNEAIRWCLRFISPGYWQPR
jgi:hypothetical protein